MREQLRKTRRGQTARIVIQKILRERRTCIISMHNDKYSTKARIAMRKGERVMIFKKRKKKGKESVHTITNVSSGRQAGQTYRSRIQGPTYPLAISCFTTLQVLRSTLDGNTKGRAKENLGPTRASREKDRRNLDSQTKKRREIGSEPEKELWRHESCRGRKGRGLLPNNTP